MNAAGIEVDLWVWTLDVDAARQADLRAHLTPDERARASRFLRPRDRRHFEAARGRMREILSGYCAEPADGLRFSFNSHGKPSLPGGPGFNLSHAAGWAALAVADSATIGVDIERFRTVEPAVAERFFSPAEQTALGRLPAQDWAAGFFRCWTRKEALVKALGAGLTLPLDAFDVSLAPGTSARVQAMRLPGEDAGDWALAHLDLAADFVGAVATRGPARIRLREGHLPLLMVGDGAL